MAHTSKRSWEDFIARPLEQVKQLVPHVFTFALKLPKLGGISDIMDRGVRMYWPRETVRIMREMPAQGIFLTGIESSDPYVDGKRRNQLQEAHDFYNKYEERLEKIHQLGITWLRFGIPYSEAHPAPDTYNFELMEKVVNKCQQLGITLIVDLLHFGLPEWMHVQNPEEPFFQNQNFPYEFAKYARVFARRFPSIRYYTLVNEPFVTANLSAKVGLWNEQKKITAWDDDRDFVRAVKNIARAAILARRSIEKIWLEEQRPGNPVYVQNESFEVARAEPGSSREQEAKHFNTRRFAALDLIFGQKSSRMREYLLNQGLEHSEYEWFMEHGSSSSTILGIDHYPWCVYILEDNEGVNVEPLQRYQLYELAKEYWRRYKLPLLHTEINAPPEYAVEMCEKTYEVLKKLAEEGYPIVGMAWYGDEYQVGWHAALSGPKGFEEYPVGLYYKGEPQPVALLFKEKIEQGLAQPRYPIFSIFRR